jgi:TRAP-type mannitol/chloroaromatic compound transport system permease large subunit
MRLRKELWFGFSLMAIIVTAILVLMPWGNITNGHLGLLMLALIVVAIMLGFPTAFTLMGLGMFFAWLAYRSVNPDLAVQQTLDLMVQRGAYGVMSNDVLIAVPLFVFMGYLVERAALIDRLFKSLHLATVRVPGSLAVATIITCAIFATATGIVGAVVTLMGLLALPAMLKAGYNVKIAAGSITAGGCLGILIPPSVLLIVYGATAGVSVVKLYAGAFFPGIMLAGLYLAYVIVLAKWKPELMPPLPENERRVPLPPTAQALSARGSNAFAGLWRSLAGGGAGVAKRSVLAQLVITLLPALLIVAVLVLSYRTATAPAVEVDTAGLVQAGGSVAADIREEPAGLVGGESQSTGLGEPPAEPQGTGLGEPPAEQAGATGLGEPPAEGAKEARQSAPAEAAPPAGAQEPQGAERRAEAVPEEKVQAPAAAAAQHDRLPVPDWFWIMLGVSVALLAILYKLWNWERLEVFKMLLTSFFPLAILILAVLGSIVFGLATPTEAAAVGAFGGFVLATAYRFVGNWREAPRQQPKSAVVAGTVKELGTILKESSFLTAKTSAMVCWLFVGSAIFSAAFALLGGQEIINEWVLSMNLTPLQFMILAQFIIFILGWPLEWTEIIVIFMPIFIPLLAHFNIDPLFFGLLVALNLQTAFLSPPVAMAAFYLKGVSPPHVTLNQIFAGMMPFMAIQVIAIFLLYMFPAIGLWLPNVLYK